ncbi:peptidoglycan-binding protein [Propioniciclava coleopterorum]|uniref:Peptidoglycan-binding protein n=1 Tax=Propioniciclava coleopterorum TaxID=2714937 RepID=A0A6G7Y5K4_9ACTN|nr:peptidoglycan-binding domain-containing protein [Propioniciclava coleopterorum]QIK72063.1 peptidoglycan-binding protein [Propioniciclava coleopterorum]
MLVSVVLGGAAVWAASYVMRPAANPLESNDHVLVEVVDGEVGSSISLNAIARWPTTSAGVNRASGVVTSRIAEGATNVTQGSALYTVGLRPVVAGEGAVPAFRPIGPGDRGDDVAQVQRMLRDLSLYQGSINGRVDSKTEAAIRAWQRRLMLPVTGRVEAGDIVFLPDLPSRVALDPKAVAVGKQLSGGEEALSVLGDAPEFELPVSTSQRSLIPEGTVVELTGPQGEKWDAVTGAPRAGEGPDLVVVPLVATGSSICADQCGSLAVNGETRLAAKVITVPTRSGLVVPSSSLVSGFNGEVAVVDEGGAMRAVHVVASARGMSVIEGVERGLRVRIQKQ